MAVFVIALLSLTLVSALDGDLEETSLRINGDYYEDAKGTLSVEEGQKIKIRLGLYSLSGVNDVEVDAKISGYEYSDFEPLSDATELFNIQPDSTVHKNLEITLPTKLDRDTYTLYIRALSKSGAVVTFNYDLLVEPKRHAMDIADVALYPGNTVKAGRTLAAKVLVVNYGEKDEDDVRISMEIPALGASATPQYVEVETEKKQITENGVEKLVTNLDYQDADTMFLQIPASAAEGDYQVLVTVEYDDFRDTVTKTFTIHVTGNPMFQNTDSGKLVLAVGPETQSVAAGQTARYGVALTNAGVTSKAFVLETLTGDWATSSLSDNLIVLEPGKNQVVYVDVTAAKNAVAGPHSASVMVKSGNEVLQTVTLNANVATAQTDAGSNLGLRNGLEIALIILVVLLVIIGLIIGFSRLRKDDDEEQTYY